MPSKKSKPIGSQNFRSNVAQTYSEPELVLAAREWVSGINPGLPMPRFILKGEMGAGKSTLARALIDALGVDRAAEGSPTFAIAHEYVSRRGIRILHADGYRLKSEVELESTGLLEPLWDPDTLVLFEWLDLFPVTEEKLFKSGLPIIQITLSIHSENLRKVVLSR